MKLSIVILLSLALVLSVVKTAGALTIIGTASYDSDGDHVDEVYNLIYEEDSVFGGLVWFDFTKSANKWDLQNDWVQDLSFTEDDITLNGYTTDIDFGSGWRLPIDTAIGNELEHLFEDSLGNTSGLLNTGPFDNLEAEMYWTSAQPQGMPGRRITFDFGDGEYGNEDRIEFHRAIAVHDGEVTAVPVPEPSALILFTTGLLGLIGIRKWGG
nr:hypothetical protein 2 [Desulfobacterales bacterium]